MNVKEKVKWIPVILIVCGLLLFFVHEVGSGLTSLQSLFIKVEHPTNLQMPAYAALLKQYVKGDLVDYPALRNSPALKAAVNELKGMSPDTLVNESDQLAFWINAYNLLVLEAVCEKYPLGSVKQLGNAYSAEQFIVGGKPITIQNLYLEEVFPLAKKIEPGSIFLVCQGAIGYPPLQDHIFDAANLNSESKTALYRFVNDPKNATFEQASRRFMISPFFQWTRDLFSQTFSTPHSFVNYYRNEKVDMRTVKIMETFTLPFDWRLNDVRFAAR